MNVAFPQRFPGKLVRDPLDQRFIFNFFHDDDFDDSVNQLSMNAAIVIVEHFQYNCHFGFDGVHYGVDLTHNNL